NLVLYVYYGNASATNQQNPSMVWDTNYAAIWRLPNGSTLSANDSTNNANNGTISAATAITGQIDGAASFDGSSKYISANPSGSLLIGSSDITIEVWFNPSNFPTYENLIHHDRDYSLVFDGSGNLSYANNSNWSFLNFGFTSIGMQPGVWQHIALT